MTVLNRTGSDAMKIAWMYIYVLFFSLTFQISLAIAGVTSLSGAKYALVYSLPWLVVPLLLPRVTKVWFAAIGVVFFICSSIKILYLMIYHQELSQSIFFTIFETNASEGTEYFSAYFNWLMVPAITLYAFIAVLLFRQIRPIVVSSKRNIVLACVILVSVVEPYATYWQGWEDVTFRRAGNKLTERLSATTPWQMAISYLHYRDQTETIRDYLAEWVSGSRDQDVMLTDQNPDQTYVLVIGESTNRDRMSLYGYGRPTTPLLERAAFPLLKFEDVIATRPTTIESLQHALTFETYERPLSEDASTNVVALMNAAGFETTWITNQQTVSDRNTMLTAFSMMADKQIFLNNNRRQDARQWDEAVFEPYKKALAGTARKKFIVVHLLGTHSGYHYRYPPRFSVFEKETMPSQLVRLTADEELVYDAYDDAILYNDYVLWNLLNEFHKRTPYGALLYFADHGEEVFDHRHFRGRNELDPSPEMYTVPFLLSLSDRFVRNRFSSVKVRSSVDRAYSLEWLMHTWCDLVAIQFKLCDPSMSVINDAYQNRTRFIGDPTIPSSMRTFASLIDDQDSSVL